MEPLNPERERGRGETPSLGPCQLCDHPSDWHRLDDSKNISPTDPAAKFRCIGYDCTRNYSSPIVGDCDCPDYMAAL